jgi:hypothetical protein
MPDWVGDGFEAPLERDEAKFGSYGVTASPPSGLESAGGGGSRNANNGAGHRDPNGEKIKEGIEGEGQTL